MRVSHQSAPDAPPLSQASSLGLQDTLASNGYQRMYFDHLERSRSLEHGFGPPNQQRNTLTPLLLLGGPSYRSSELVSFCDVDASSVRQPDLP